MEVRIMSSNSVVDDIIEELGNCQDPSQIKELTDKLKDAMYASPGDLNRKIIEKWANKLKPFKDENDIKNLAFLLENQYTYNKNNAVFDGTSEEQKKVDLLKEQAEEIGGEAGEILLKQAEEKEKNLPPKLEETFPMRGVNIQDEIVKFYDCITMKPMINIQPMVGPVGLAYAIRFRPPLAKKDITKNEVLKRYKESLDFSGAGKMTSVSKFEDIPETYLDSLRYSYNIEGEPKTENTEGLTVEQKEVVARTRKLKLKGVQKVSGPEIAKEVDRELAHRVVNMAYPVGFVSTEMLVEQLKASIDDVKNMTKIGEANCILSNGKYITEEIEELFEHNIVFPHLNDDVIVVGYSGKKQNDTGLIYCPYVPIIFAKGSGEYASKCGVMTRYGIVDNIYGSEHFYHKMHVIDASEEIVKNFRRFYKNTMQDIDNEDMKKRVTCITMRVFQELSENFTKVIPVAEEVSDDMEDVKLKARWNIEAEQDLKALHNLDLGEELMEIMAIEVVKELKELDFNELHSFGFQRTSYETLSPREGVYVKVLKKDESKVELS
jgi:hypothetical protein